MTSALLNNSETTSRNNIVDIALFQDLESSGSTSPLTDLVKSDEQFDTYLKNLIEQNVFKILMMEQSNRDELNNPFSSIYLCDLKPDANVGSSITDIMKVVDRIEDRSGDLFFDDGLD